MTHIVKKEGLTALSVRPLKIPFKNFLYILFAFFCPYNLYGQKNGEFICKSEIECQYLCQQSNGWESVFLLRYGKGVCQFYSIEKLRHDSLIANGGGGILLNEMIDRLEKREASGKKVDKRVIVINSEILYRNLHKGKISVFNNSYDQYVTYDEDIPFIDWKIYEDSTRTILGYDCHLAKAMFRGRQWDAWFTENIPLSVGPWKLGDLPGLILEATTENYMAFSAISISTNVIPPLTFYNNLNNKYKSINREKYLEMKKTPLIVPYVNVRIDPFPYIEIE